ncbi:MAG: hypothetical protein AAF741_12470 [Bacteroidota bacterium]
MNKNTNTILLVLLLLLLIGALFWGFNQSKKAADAQAGQEELGQELSQMELLRDGLSNQVDSLSMAYEAALGENEELAGSLAAAQQQLANTQAELRRTTNIKNETARSAYNIRVQIEELLEVRSTLERQLLDVRAQNDSLRTVNLNLRNELSGARNERDDLADLNDAMQREIETLTLGNFKATAFQVETLQRNNKVGDKGKRIRNIKVEFDLTSVPEEYQGVRPIYLVITDASGTPIPTENPIQRTVTVNGSEMALRAQEAKDYNVEESQRISFVHELSDKLNSGVYRAQIFTDIGILGASSFRLN